MKYADKRTVDQNLQEVQAANRQWWTDHTMSYDWRDKVEPRRFSALWFDEIDRRFIHGSRLFAHGGAPFDQIIPFANLAGRCVLEIGCGMGLHSELMARAGAKVTAVDISDTSIEATRRRAMLKGLAIDVRHMDATALDFADVSFDFVWSWGAIHHSSHTGRIIREVYRVLKPCGEFRVMVYNLAGMWAYVAMMRRYALGFWFGKSLDEILWRSTDGYMARFYSPDVLTDTFSIFFDDVNVKSYGQESDAIPLPRFIRSPLLRLIPENRLAGLANKRGSFLFVTATKASHEESSSKFDIREY